MNHPTGHRPEISFIGATLLELALDASMRGDTPRLIGTLMSIDADDFHAAKARCAELGLDLRDLFRPPAPVTCEEATRS